MREESIAGLRTVIAGGPDRQGGGDGPLVVLFHGFGANGDDLVGLWRALDVPRATRFAFPEAPLSLAGGYGAGSFAWWMIDVERIGLAMQGRVPPDDVFDETPDGLADARARAQVWLVELAGKLGPAGGLARTVLGGFSQGGALAIDLALRAPLPPLGLVVLSGVLCARREWRALLPAAHGAPLFHSHGTRDPLLPVPVGEALHGLLATEGPYRGELVRFPGGHEIPFDVLQKLGAWLGELVRQPGGALT